MRLSHGIPLRGKQLSNKEKIVSAVSCVSGAANDHNTAFFRIGQFFFYIYIYNLSYSLLKNTRYPNLWPPYGGNWSKTIIFSFMGKYIWGVPEEPHPFLVCAFKLFFK